MTEPREHIERSTYGSPIGALEDALRVLGDLRDLSEGQVLVPASDLDFLARRAAALVKASLDHHIQQALASGHEEAPR